AEEELAALERASSECEREIGVAQADHGRIATELASAREAERDAQAVLDLEARRPDLEPGKPCPLCGSADHPWAGGEAPPAAAMVRKWSERRDALEIELLAAERRIGQLQATASEQKGQWGRRSHERDAAAAQAEALQRKWEEAREGADGRSAE